jgi:hypothetical protein
MDPYAEQPEENPPPRPRRGCLWGCLGTLIAGVVLIGAVYSYYAWYFYKGFANDPRIQMVMEVVKKNDEATRVLGQNITVQGRERYTYDYATGRGGNATYVLTVVGSNGEGRVKAELDISGDKTKITTLVLIDAQGRNHYLVGTAPPNPMMIQNSI